MVLELKKPHACGTNRWEVVRVGADIKLKCLGCDRLVMAPRAKIERRIRRISDGDGDTGSKDG